MLAVFVLDRVTKIWILKTMFLGESKQILPFLAVTYVENTGIAFGFGQNNNRVFLVLSILLFGILIFLRRSWQKQYGANRILEIGFALVIGGALGNIYDRIVYGSVVDFLDFFVGRHHWPAFNVADSAICIGAFILAFLQVSVTKTDI